MTDEISRKNNQKNGFLFFKLIPLFSQKGCKLIA